MQLNFSKSKSKLKHASLTCSAGPIWQSILGLVLVLGRDIHPTGLEGFLNLIGSSSSIAMEAQVSFADGSSYLDSTNSKSVKVY